MLIIILTEPVFMRNDSSTSIKSEFKYYWVPSACAFVLHLSRKLSKIMTPVQASRVNSSITGCPLPVALCYI